MPRARDRARVRRHFDRVASGYAKRFSRGPLAALRWTERRELLALLKPGTGERILDAGCGAGLTAKRLGELGCVVHGVDWAPNMVAAARARGVRAEVADLHELALGSLYPKILCAGPLEFCADPATVIERLAQHLEPGGRLVILFPMPTPVGRLYRFYYRALGIDVRLFGLDEMTALIERASLVVREIRRPVSFSVAISAEKPR